MTRIVFMGTPEFATPVLAALADNYEVVAVYARADKPTGRGRTLSESPVKLLARDRGLVVEHPRTLRNDQALARLREYHPDMIVVAAYGLILPKAVLDIPPRGCINTHASLLPRWRGASPITFAILAGDTETGITLMQMDEGVDTGPILARRKIPIASDETTGTLTEKLSHLAAELLLETLPAWLEGRITTLPQSGEATFSTLIKKEAGLIDWITPAVEIERAVRAYNPWPSAFTFWNGARLQVWRVQVSEAVVPELPGTIVQVNQGLGVKCGEGILILQEVQLAGKRAMSIDEFVRGQRGFVGARLGNPNRQET
jgi:methionyl-tRNA formyltransferase